MSAAAIRYVPASILSNIIEYVVSLISVTPVIFIDLFDNQEILHPIFLKKLIKSKISGSIAQFDSIVMPLAKLAAIIKFSVAPTDIFEKRILLPCKPFGALA